MKQTQSSYTFGSLLLILVGVTVVYQLTFHAIVRHAMQQEDEDASCSTFGDSPGASPKCLELRLFRSWQKASVEPHESEDDLLHLMGSEDLDSSAKPILRGPPDSGASSPSEMPAAVRASAESTRRAWDTTGFTHEVKAPAWGFSQPVSSPAVSPFEAELPEDADVNDMADRLMGLQNELHDRLEILVRKNGTLVDDSLASDIADARKRIESRKQSIQDVRKLLNHDIPNQIAMHEDLVFFNDFDRSVANLSGSHQAKMPPNDYPEGSFRTDSLQNVTQSPESDITPWAADLMHLQERLESRRKALLEAHSKRTRHQIPPEVNMTQTSENHSTAWAIDLMHLQERLEARQKALSQAHSKPLRQQQSYTSVPASENAKGSAHEDLSQLHLEVERHHQMHEERNAAAAARMHDLGKKVADQKDAQMNWQAAMSSSIIDYKKKLCTELRRSDDPLCKQFAINQNSSAGVDKDSGNFAGDMTSKTSHSSVADAAAGSPPSSFNGFLAPAPVRLHWSAAKAWSSISRDAGLVSVNREQLTGLKWAAQIPKVACITIVPRHHEARARMKYFINNFLLQQYEGPRQLVLVYHKDDVSASRLVKTYADGVFIKGVATMGSGEFPSSTDLRYGAWKAEADIIAHWDFEEWHHPDRLALQIRALALAGRPASLLKQWTVMENGEANTVFAGIGWEGSLVGEKQWMYENWHPILGDSERSVLEDSLHHQLVQVAVPELSIFNVGPDGWESVLRHFGREDTVDISEEELAEMERSSNAHDQSSISGDQQEQGRMEAAVESSHEKKEV